jgi:hypothetical protein
VELSYEAPGIGAFPSQRPDYREFRNEIRQLKHPERSPLSVLIERQKLDLARLRDVPVIVGLPAWTSGGVSDFAATLVRQLQAAGLNAHVLLTEENTDRVDLPVDHAPHPRDLPIYRLPVARAASWGAHWGALIRYLEDRAPCLYLPNHDWRHSCVAPLLSDGVVIVGIVYANDPLHRDHVQRLGRYWNVVVVNDETAGRALAADPVLTGRVRVLPYVADDVAEDYLQVFDAAVEDMRAGVFHRPLGAFRPPPREVDGVGVFPVDRILPSAGDLVIAPGHVREYREFFDEIAQLEAPQRSPLHPYLARRAAARARLQDREVIVASPAWTEEGINTFAATLVRQLRAVGLAAQLLLTEEETDCVTLPDKRPPRPSDIECRLLPVARTEGWGAHWGAMLRYLEERAPCIYVPNHDWRHSCIAPLLSDRVAIVGIVHADDPFHCDHVQRLGRYWNAIVAHDAALAGALVRDPALAARVRLVSYREADLAADYLQVFETVVDDLETGAFQRPKGLLHPPPRELAGTGVFTVDLTFHVEGVGSFPREDPDFVQFQEHIGPLGVRRE